MGSAGYEVAIAVIKWLNTYALGLTAAGIGILPSEHPVTKLTVGVVV